MTYKVKAKFIEEKANEFFGKLTDGTIADQNIVQGDGVAGLSGQVPAQGFPKFQAHRIRVCRQVHSVEGVPQTVGRPQGTNASAEIQHIFLVQPQGPELSGLDATVHRTSR